MPRWDFALSLARGDELPVFLQVARAITEDIGRGRLRPGSRLPGSRTLARKLKVHRNTILAAYGELTAEGWVTTAPARGTFVSASLPERRPRAGPVHAADRLPTAGVGYEVRPAPAAHRPDPCPPSTLAISSGAPDLRSVPFEALSRAYRRALKANYARLLTYGEPEGYGGLRDAIASMLSATRSLPVTAANIFITRGSQMAWTLVGRALIGTGDAVAVESLGYRPAWEAFRQSGAQLLPVPVDQHGMRVEFLERLSAHQRLRLVYVTPHRQYPTTVTLSPARRIQLLQLAAAHRFAVVEDDYDHEFSYEGHPALPLASLDRHGTVIYVGTLSKVLAPGLRIGFVAAPPPLVEVLAGHRSFVDTHGDHVVEAAVATLLDDGEIQRHINRLRRVYVARRNALAELLRTQLGGVLEFAPPPGGLAIWARVRPGVDPDQWSSRAVTRGVAFHTGRRYTFDERPAPYLRLSFASLDESQLAEAVRRMTAALPRGPGDQGGHRIGSVAQTAPGRD
jgi:GntR family transcriptional regulator/MocR family aminotransferase